MNKNKNKNRPNWLSVKSPGLNSLKSEKKRTFSIAIPIKISPE